ncbi:MAG: sulfate ABC transporter substrate-binding protein [Firmicutes bacterium HGW-Firmicutes-1]|jgi:NitT/TauT family transport system substrate-binding protein|nr:MAG: sulfate ABC transporter substrate-binding protein [Firmicutes bacterium HGW-Firmicutes-1]
MLKDLKRFTVLGVIVSILVGTLSGCAKETLSENLTIRVAHFPNIVHSQALVGRVEGQFQKAVGENNVIEWKAFNAGPAEIEAFFAGEVDLGYIGPGPAINGFTKSKGDIIIIAGATDAGAILVSRKDVNMKDIKDLDGKKIAVPQFGNTQHLSLLNLLKENGLTDSAKGGSVEILAAANPDIKTLLDSGEIDAAFVPEPWGSRLIIEVGAKVVLDYNKVFRDGLYTSAVVIARKEFAEKNPEIVENFLKAHIEITEYINSDLEHAKQIVNEEIKALTDKEIDPAVLDAAFDRLTVTYNPQKDSVVDFAAFSMEAGFIEKTPDYEQLFNLTYLNKVLKEKQLEEIQS